MTGDRSEEIARLECAFMIALKERDMQFLERHLGEEFTLTTGRPGHEVRSRREWLEVARASYIIEKFDFHELIIQYYGDVALARLHFSQAGSMDGEDRSGRFRMSDVWVRREGIWQIASRHSSALADRL